MLNPILKLLHILASFWLVSGMLGRSIVFQRAKRATDLPTVTSMIQLFSFFSTKMVSIGGALVFILGLLAAWLGGWPILGFLQGGSSNWVLASLVLMIFVYITVITLAIPNGKKLGQALGQAVQRGKVTPELTGTLDSPKFKFMFVAEYLLVGLIVVLMVLKPF